MSKWIAEFELEDGDTMPEHMDLEYDGVKIDFHCRPMWIPVTERLPEKDCQCIVTAKLKHVDGCSDYETDTADYTDGEFTLANDWWCVESVIAWAPLPDPYKENV